VAAKDFVELRQEWERRAQPPRHDRYFVELTDVLAASGPPNADAIAGLRAKYDTEQLSTLVAGAEAQPAAS
jgi:hypothetical protein